MFSNKQVTKYVKKQGKRLASTAKSRYFRGQGYSQPNVSKMVADIKWLKSVLNPEKKRFDVVHNGINFGQVFVNATGAYTVDITPIPTSGVGYNQRTGSSLKIHTACLKFQVYQQIQNNHKTKFTIEIWKNSGPSISAATAMQQLYNVSSASGVIDYHSMLDPDYTGTFKRVFTKDCNITPNFSSEEAIIDVTVPLRLGHHIRFDDNGVNVTDGQLVLIMRANSGNSGGSVSTLTNVPITAATTGLITNIDAKFYYYDN